MSDEIFREEKERIINRRSVLLGGSSLASAVSASSPFRVAQAQTANHKPNVLFTGEHRIRRLVYPPGIYLSPRTG